MSIESKVSRNHSLDTLKCLCAFLVIVMHTTQSGYWTEMLYPIRRIAVPIFFIISGYFLFSSDIAVTTNRLKANISKVVSLVILSSCFYAVVNFLQGQTVEFDVIEVFLLNENPFSGPLWYLNSYLYVLFFFLVLARYKLFDHKSISRLFPLFILLLLTSLLLGRYSQLVIGTNFSLLITRNFIFTGIPFFGIGAYIKSRENNSLINLNNNSLGALIVLFVVISTIERYLLANYLPKSDGDLTISAIVLSVLVFQFALSYNQTRDTIFSRCGRLYSLDIYVFHMFFFIVLFHTIRPFFLNDNLYIYYSLLPILDFWAVCVFSIAKRKAIGLIRSFFSDYNIIKRFV